VTVSLRHPGAPTLPKRYCNLDRSRILESSSDQDYSISSAASELRDAEEILSPSPIDSTSDKWSLRHNFYKNDAHDSIIIWREIVQSIGEYSFIKPVDTTKNVPLSR
jgi:Tfp pilus assembly protein PilX